jgi:SAM-dependent MidA family methyltransferase
MQRQIENLEKFQKSKSKDDKKLDTKPKNEAPSAIAPMFIFAHELYDALPIHQFKYLGLN